ncbi:hypothetical protein CU098_003463 [Rhizopus stolonifer]|uniref:Uncharacterized protein n=1 Tax=Rhizopus stolonifer TaxID=4846 RepID=A0A367KL86_RHIST|nr:hypothetical protein CU098_003463 [Rhizopus stolonifer]
MSRGARRNPRRVPAAQFRPQQYVDPLAVALANIFPGVAMDGSAATFLDDPMVIDDPMDLDDSSDMESIEVDDPMDVDPSAFAISVMVTGRGPYAIWSQAQYHRT